MEEIIIDGVDVSECIHYKECKNGNGRCLIFDEKCHRIGIDEINEDICYYKRFKRKEQECEDLKQELKYEEEMNIKLAIDVNGKLRLALMEIEKKCKKIMDKTPLQIKSIATDVNSILQIIQKVKEN